MLPGERLTSPVQEQALPSMPIIHLAAHLSDLRAAYEAISSPQKSKLLGLTLPFQAVGT